MQTLTFTESYYLYRDEEGVWIHMDFKPANPELDGVVGSSQECLLSDFESPEAALEQYRDGYQSSIRNLVQEMYPGIYE